MPSFWDPPYVLASAIVFIVLCPLIAGLRFSIRLRAHKIAALGLDDWLVLPATFMVIGCGVCLIIGVKLGAFAHPVPDPDQGNQSFRYNEQLQWSFLLMQILGIGCTKLSFILFFRRIFCMSRLRTPFEIASAILGVFILLWTIAFFLWFLFSCPGNLAGRWKSPQAYEEYCPTDTPSDIGFSISDFLTDLSVFILPVPMVLKLHITWQRKLLILAVFAMGLLALIVSTIRMVFFIKVVQIATGRIGRDSYLIPTVDHNLLVTEGLYWSMLESGLALIACCLPMLNGLFSLPAVRSVLASVRSLQSLGSGRGSENSNAVRNLQENPTGSNDQYQNESGILLRSKPSGISARPSVTGDNDSFKPSIEEPKIRNPRLEINTVHVIEQTESIV